MIFRGFCAAILSFAIAGCQTTQPAQQRNAIPAADAPRHISITALPPGAVCDPMTELMFDPTWPKANSAILIAPDKVGYGVVRILRLTCRAPSYRVSVRFLRSEQGANAADAQAAGAAGFFGIVLLGGASGSGGISHLAASYRFPPEISISMVPETGARPAQIGAERQAISEGVEAWRELRLEMCKAERSPTDEGLSAGCERDLDRIKKTEAELLERVDSW